MIKKNLFSCFLIGEDTLIIKCAEILIERNHAIWGIVSPLPSVMEWASKNQVSYFISLDDAAEALKKKEFDYLFSIVNSQVLPADVLRFPRQFSINYHDAPLPSYAGVHATCWAILNGEKNHGITWHVINDVIDGGDILKQVIFEIEEDETALSLNLKCYHHAVQAFSALADELANHTYHRASQDLDKRTYYGFNKKPVGNGWISWDDRADNIDKLCRALHLGEYINKFSLPKFLLGGEVFVINKWQLMDGHSKNPSGTLVALDQNGWQVSTATNDILLENLIGENGKLNLILIAKQYNLTVGCRLSSPSPELLHGFEKICEKYSKHEKFWVEKLLNFEPASLPFAASTFTCDKKNQFTHVQSLTLSEELYKQLKIFPSKNVEIGKVILTAWMVYLYRLGNHENLGVNLYCTHSLHTEVTPLLSNFFPFSINLNKDIDFEHAVGVIVNQLSSLYKHGFYLKDIIHRYQILSNAGRAPLIAVMIQENSKIQLEEVRSAVLFIISNDGKKLSWLVNESLVNADPYLSNIFHNVSRQFSCLLKSVIQEDKKNINDLSLLPKQEYQKITLEWSKSEFTKTIKSNSIPHLFESQALKSPDSIAVICRNEYSLTYAELNQKANKLAHYLQGIGLKKGMFVAICSGHDPQLLICLLAVLKLGATYIPIDSHISQQHINSIIEDTQLTIVLFRKKFKKIVNYFISNKKISSYVIDIDDLLRLTEKGKESNLEQNKTGQDNACVIYTSGSTGKPKGVMISHDGIIRLIKNPNYIQFSSHDRIAQAASIGFDASIFEIWGALLNGACVVCVPNSTLLHAIQFARFLKEESISVLWLTSALFSQYALAQPCMFRYLQYLVVGGDIVNPEMIKSVMECSLGTPRYILNGYGPTENTTFTTTYSMTPKILDRFKIPIGKPISGTSVYVLDEKLECVPVGFPGELYIGGMGVSKGYLNRAALTAQRFIINPFKKYEHDKLYKTGDIVCWLPDGNLDYLGRKDNQVKIRGFRVELEAVQIYLLNYKKIHSCFVRVLDEKKRGKTLVAYLVPTKGYNLNFDEIENFLHEHLPAYMIPTFFISLEKFPLTENGKIDSKLLPHPDLRKKTVRETCITPRNSVENKLFKIWTSIFENQKISIDDNFFSLGGHSLLLTKLILDVYKNFYYDLSINEFLKNPTIRYLARLIKGNDKNKKIYPPSRIISKDISTPINFKLSENKFSDIVPASILLTGASGFLGVHLLHDLYRLTTSKIYCFVRAENVSDAKNKLFSSIERYGFNINDTKRIIVIAGDFSKPYLGLSTKLFERLSEEIDAIYHNGAYVHHLYDYKMLRSANVLGTIELLKLATLYRIKSFYYISTLSVLSPESKTWSMADESFISSNCIPQKILDGYSQTKWASERILCEIHNQGVPIKIFRPGWILGQSDTGVVSPNNNHLLLLIKGCIQIGFAPKWKVKLNILPVDFISNLIIKISTDQKTIGDVFNLVNPKSITWIQLIRHLNNYGYPIKMVSPEIWKNKHLRKIRKDNALFSLFSIYINSDDSWMENLDCISNISYKKTLSSSKKLGLISPKIDEILLEKYFSFLRSVGFFGSQKINKQWL